jgi:putative membrane protein
MLFSLWHTFFKTCAYNFYLNKLNHIAMKKTLLIIVSALVFAGMNIKAQDMTGSSMDKDMKNDTTFINDAASGDMMEVQLGKLAQQNGTTQMVRDFGKLMEKDHSDANQKLMDVAKKMGYTIPTGLKDKHQDNIDKLRKETGSDFDKEYMDLMVKDHKDDVSEFEKQEGKVNNSDLRQWITNTLPVLTQHQANAESIQQQLKEMK